MSFFEYLVDQWDDLLQATIEHIVLVGTAIAIATVVALTIAMLTYRTRFSANAIAVAAIIITIPSLALYSVLIGPLGIGSPPALVALILYAQLAILRNAVVGLRGVDQAVVESAQGMGMTKTQRLFRIELPLAWPVVITGIRVSTLIVVGIAAIAAVINAPGLGKEIFRGLARIGSPTALNLALSGTLGVILVGILFDAVFNVIGKLTTSRGIR
jgi:osmoprotectant transport system permease protein